MIHKFRHSGLYIVLDVDSGHVHVVDEIVYELLDYVTPSALAEPGGLETRLQAAFSGKYSPEEIAEAVGEIGELAENGALFAKGEYAEYARAVKRSPVVKALCLQVAHDCNMKCAYCFAGEGEYHGERQLMSAETGRAAIDFLIAQSGSRRNLEVDFFGGEPTMNFGVVMEIVEYARKIERERGKNFRFTITTNGLLLNAEMTDFINENMQNVVLSLDGRREVNDAMRKNAGGAGTYDAVVPKFRELVKRRGFKDYYVRGTFTRVNLDFANDVLHIADLGFSQISVEPVVAEADKPYAILAGDLPRIFEEYDRLSEIMKAADFNFFHFDVDLTGGPCVAKRLRGCGAGTEYLAVAPNGDLYPCHQFTGLSEFKMGDVFGGGLSRELRDRFESRNLYSASECPGCFAKFYCGGGCAANAYQQNGDPDKPYAIGCELQKKRTECAIGIKAGLAYGS